MRHSDLRFAPIALVFAAAACTASGSDDQAHGPIFGPNDGGTDAAVPTTDGSPGVTPDGSTPPPPPPSDAGGDTSPPPPPPVDGGTDAAVDAGSCTDKTAVLAENGATLYESVQVGAGAWTTATAAGTFHGGAALVAAGTGFQGVAIGAGNALQWTSWAGSTWSSLAPIGGATTTSPPALAPLGAAIHLVYRGVSDSKYYHGTFASNAWDTATDPVGGSAAQSFGPTGVGMSAIAGALVLTHKGGDNANLYAEGLAAQSGVAVGAAQTEALVPAIVAMTGGANDAMILYIHTGDFRVSWATRAAGVWTDHGAIDTTLFTSVGIPVAAVALPSGNVVLVYQGSDGKAYASRFNGTTWSLPATNLAPGALGGLPAISPGACGDDAIVALPMATGPAQVVRLRGGAWTAAEPVTGTSAATVVAVATTK